MVKPNRLLAKLIIKDIEPIKLEIMKKSNEQKAFGNGWLEGKYFQKDYGSLLGEDKEAISEQIQEDWEVFKDKNP